MTRRALEYVMVTVMGLAFAYAVATPVAEFIGQSFANAAANLEQAGK